MVQNSLFSGFGRGFFGRFLRLCFGPAWFSFGNGFDSVVILRITVITTGTPFVIAQIKQQINRLVCVHGVADLTENGPVVEREIALFKVSGTGDNRVEALRLADAFRARVVDATPNSFVFEMTGTSEKLDAFSELMRPIGLVDISRAGVVAISRGDRAMEYFADEKDCL